jgi:O-antigen/teichoic acid export membrane protein
MTFNKQLLNTVIWRGIYFSSVFLLNIVVARTYQAEVSGWINFISNNFALVLLFGSLSLDIAVLYYGASHKIETSKLAFFSIVWSAVISLIFFLSVGSFIDKSDNILSKGLLKFAANNYFIGIIITNFFINLFLIKEEFIIPNALLSIMNFVLIITIPNTFFGLNLFTKETYIYLYYFGFLVQGFVLVIAYFVSYGKIKISLPSKQELLKLFRYAFLAFLGNLVFFLVYRVDYWFVNAYRSNAIELGNYIQASKIGQMLLVFSMIIANTVFPQTASGHTIVVIERISIIIRNFVAFFGLITIFLLSVGQNITTYVFGPSFNQMFWPFMYLLPGLFSLSILNIFSAYFGGMNKTIVNVKGALIGLIIIAILDFLFIKKYGIIGAAVISSIGYFATMCYSIYCFHLINPIRISSLFQLRLSDFLWIPKLFKSNK